MEKDNPRGLSFFVVSVEVVSKMTKVESILRKAESKTPKPESKIAKTERKLHIEPI